MFATLVIGGYIIYTSFIMHIFLPYLPTFSVFAYGQQNTCFLLIFTYIHIGIIINIKVYKCVLLCFI